MNATWKHETSGEEIEIEFTPATPDRFYVRNTADGPEGDWFPIYLDQDAISIAEALEVAGKEDPDANGWLSNLWPVPAEN